MKKFTALIISVFMILVLPTSAMAATLNFSPNNGTINRGCEVSIKIELDTTGADTDGTDAVVIFEPAKFTTSTQAITNGTIYQEYPGNTVDTSQSKVSISGLAPVQQPFKGQGTLATIKFTVPANAPTGSTQLRFDFDPANPTKTTDSNVVERGTVKDVLTQAPAATYTIGTGACSGQTAAPPSYSTPAGAGAGQGAVVAPGSAGTGTTSTLAPEPQKTLPSAGISEPTVLISIAGGILVFLGILGLALL